MDSEVKRNQRERMIDYFISNQDLQPSVLLQLARMFKCKAKLLEEKNSGGSNVRALEARLKADCLVVLPLLEGLCNGQTADSSSIQVYEFIRKSLDKVELTDVIEENDLTDEVVRNKLSESTSRKIQSSEFSLQHGKGARSNLESPHSAAQQVVQAIESLKQEYHKDRRELISKLDELIKVTDAKDEKQRAQTIPTGDLTSKPTTSMASNLSTGAKMSFGDTTTSPAYNNSTGFAFGQPSFGTPKVNPIVTPASTASGLFFSPPPPVTQPTKTGLENPKISGIFGYASSTPSVPANPFTFGSTQTSIFGTTYSQPTTITTTATSIFGMQPAMIDSPYVARPDPPSGDMFGYVAGVQANVTPSFGLLPTQTNSQPVRVVSFGAPAVTSAEPRATTTASSATPFGYASKPFTSNSSFGQTAVPTANLFSPSSAATSQTGNFLGPNTATSTPIIACPEDTGKKESVLPTDRPSYFSFSAANTSWQQPVSKTNSNTTFTGAETLISGAKVASNVGWGTSTELLPNRTRTNDAIPLSSTTTNVFRAKDDNGWTVLHSACSDGNLDFVKFLVEKGADVNAKNDDNETVLHYACARGKMDIVAFLVEKGADVNVKGYNGATALHYAAKDKHWDALKFLVNKGADVNVKDDGGETVLNLTALRGGLDVIKFLLEKGADVNATDQYGFTALRWAIVSNTCIDAVKHLVKFGANVRAKGNNGETVLHAASRNGFFIYLEFLLDHGADINAEDNDGESALHYASRSNYSNLDTIKFLIEKGADANVKNKNGQTALYLARQVGNLNIVRYFLEKGCVC